MTCHISRPPKHPWRKQHYKHISDAPAFDIHCFDALGTFAGNLARVFGNMGHAYAKALTAATNTNR